ncbi:hypothetical protein [Scleromatobacter humisilvae]|uniref:DUF2268 domain-containing protein n=1 Tax=Scleromatobacter humisilvae TaxID=2897159 RepID=A0A9X2C2H2_9BURK|nr:hypothetical protein [Scleromatobacter humisilvae]MCK9686000.1 hypothetical protein [Scleromatobacter humisilvae]
MTIQRSVLALAIALPLFAGCAAEAPVPAPTTTRFEFHSAFLMNLHHFLVDAARHPGRIDNVKWSAPPTGVEMAAMHEAVAYYASAFGQRNLLFDDQLRDIKHALARADDALERADGLGLPPALAAVLDRAAPAYARCLWAGQDRVNREWIARVQVLEARYGARIQPRLERIFEARFPASIRDDIVVETGEFTGAYTDSPPPQSVLPSGRPGYDGLASLEMIWHEASHTGADDQLVDLIETEAKAMGRPVPESLWHAALFEAVGTTVSDVLAQDGVSGYVEYAQKNGVYSRAWPAYVPVLRDDWQPWLAGRGSLKGAVDSMLSRLPAPAKPVS